MKYLLLLVALNMFTVFSQTDSSFRSGIVMGKLINEGSDTPLFDVHVFIETSTGRCQAKSDFDGKFRIDGIPAGEHSIHFRYFNDTTSIDMVQVNANEINNLGELEVPFLVLTGCVCGPFNPRLRFGINNPLKPTIIGEEDLRHSVFR